MKTVWPVLLRFAITFAVLVGLAFLIPYYFLVPGGILASLFLFKTSDDRALAWGILLGSAAFGVFEYLYGTV